MRPAIHAQRDASCEKSETSQDDVARILKEYQDFAYSVSHDLNAPLRHVKEFTRLLIDARSKGPSEEEQEYIALLKHSLQKLDDMQQGLLTFSRVHTIGQDFKTLETHAVLADVLRILDPEITAYNPQIKIGELPNIQGDEKQIHAVFHHILDNALKFHPADAARKISVTAQSDQNQHIFKISDNGIGIEKPFQHDVFRMFRRLHAGDTYPGIGTGLTIAQKMIERHNGSIWIESEIDQGTDIFFALPKSNS